MDSHELTDTLPWLRSGNDFLLAAVDRLTDDELREPSGLPGWSRAHLVAHIARNAEALGRLAAWARTGVETPMYASPDQRNADIEESAGYPAGRLREELASTAADLSKALGELDEAAWRSSLRSAQGRSIPATEVPWMRVREVWLHTVDLATGAQMADLPAGVLDALTTDVCGTLSSREGCPAVLLWPSDRAVPVRLGPEDVEPVTLSGSAADLTGWLVGRGGGRGGAAGLNAKDGRGEVAVPVAPRWL
jgi:maleylpyruvate isomerase